MDVADKTDRVAIVSGETANKDGVVAIYLRITQIRSICFDPGFEWK